MVPTEEFPPEMLSTDHVIAGLVVPGNVALNCCVAPSITLLDVGETEPPVVTVTVTLALFVVSATLVALTV